jgi:hypothetical protein
MDKYSTVLATVKENGLALEHASAELQNDREIVLERFPGSPYHSRHTLPTLGGNRMGEDTIDLYESAGAAFASIGAGDRLTRNLVKQKCKLLTNIFHLESTKGCAESQMFQLFKQRGKDMEIFGKPVRVCQIKGTDKICFFSDIYWEHTRLIERFVATCRTAGLETTTFLKMYPVGEGTIPVNPDEPQWQSEVVPSPGYNWIYRGKLFGVVL